MFTFYELDVLVLVKILPQKVLMHFDFMHVASL